MASLKVQSSTKRKRMISHSLTYLYLLILSVIILFPLMVTVSCLLYTSPSPRDS